MTMRDLILILAAVLLIVGFCLYIPVVRERGYQQGLKVGQDGTKERIDSLRRAMENDITGAKAWKDSADYWRKLANEIQTEPHAPIPVPHGIGPDARHDRIMQGARKPITER